MLKTNLEEIVKKTRLYKSFKRLNKVVIKEIENLCSSIKEEKDVHVKILQTGLK